MPDATYRSTATIADELFDKYTLPKAALALILAASFVGTAVSVRLAGQWLIALSVAKWGFFVALGVLAGGLLWKHGFVRPADVATDADEYCVRMYDRFRRISIGAVGVLVPTAIVLLRQYIATGVNTTTVVLFASVIGALTLTTTLDAVRPASVETDFRSPLGLAALALALTAVGVTAFVDVSTVGGDRLAVAVRALHLLAFAVWLGGAVWNIFVAVPSGQVQPTMPVIRAAGQQLERFRWAVRFIIPTIFVTGAYQGVDALGVSPGVYLETLVGLAVVAKVGVIGVLVVIFKLCPMWRACSPIDGVCELADREDSTTGAAGGGDDD